MRLSELASIQASGINWDSYTITIIGKGNKQRKAPFKCNAHGFRRGFACNLHRKGLSTLDIMHLGGWEDLSMVLRYTRSITFDDCLKHYRAVLT